GRTAARQGSSLTPRPVIGSAGVPRVGPIVVCACHDPLMRARDVPEPARLTDLSWPSHRGKDSRDRLHAAVHGHHVVRGGGVPLDVDLGDLDSLPRKVALEPTAIAAPLRGVHRYSL